MLRLYHRRHEERIAIPKKSTRTLLFAWCKSSITKSQLFNLKKELSSSPEIYEAFLWTEENFHVLPKGVKGFFCCLAKASPVCSYIPYSEECYDLINHLFNEKARGNPSTLESLQRKMPIIYKLVTEFSSKLPLEYKGMLFKLISLSQSPFIKNIPITKSSYEDPMSYFPALPVVRSRGRYSIDTAKEESLCSKAYPSHKKLTAGIFTLYCIHGKIYLSFRQKSNVNFILFSSFRFLLFASCLFGYVSICGMKKYNLMIEYNLATFSLLTSECYNYFISKLFQCF